MIRRDGAEHREAPSFVSGGLGHLFVIPTTDAGREAGKVAREAIGLFIELRDVHGHDDAEALEGAVSEIEEGYSVDVDELIGEALERRRLSPSRCALKRPPMGDLPS